MSQINVSITQKLMAMAGAILLLAGGAQVYLAYEIDLSDEVINGVIDEQALILARLHTIQATANQFGDMRYWLTDLAVSWQNESEENAEAALESLQTLLGELESTDREVVAAIRPLIQQFHDVMIEAVDAYVDDNRVLGNSKVADGRAHVVTVNNELRQILTAADEQAKNATQALTLNNSALLFTALIGLAVAFVIGSMLTWLGDANQISEGNLSTEIEVSSTDETGQLLRSFATMQSNLREVIGAIKAGAVTVQSGADEISQGNANLSQRTEQQASALEETASSMEEMTSTVKHNADNARQADNLADGAQEQAGKGGEVVGKAVEAMGAISESSRKISDIIGVIDEIAFQTNLLALNAAVEAARAGDHGRGFAVVASEVRNLAGRSATAAKEIKGLIEDSGSKVEEGTRLVDESGQTLEEIVNAVKKVSDIVAEIAAASQEQSEGIEQVNRAIMEMDEMTQQNAALVEEAASAAEAMGARRRTSANRWHSSTLENRARRARNLQRRTAAHPTGLSPGGRQRIRPSRGKRRIAEFQPMPKKAAAGGGSDEVWEEF